MVCAWITTALDDDSANGAILLAKSLRRVYTSKKLVAFVSVRVSEKFRGVIKHLFDLVLPFEPKGSNIALAEDLVKVEALSLSFFEKCVYLSPNTLVIKNCDNIFEKDAVFAACSFDEADLGVDSSVFLFTSAAIEAPDAQSVAKGSDEENPWLRWLSLMQQSGFKMGELDERYNFRVQTNQTEMNMDMICCRSISIVNFGSAHPFNGKRDGFLQLKFPDLVKLKLDLTPEIKDHHFRRLERYRMEPIAIVGLSFRLPGANDVDELEDLLMNGKEAIREVPSFRWTKEHSFFPCVSRHIRAGFLKDPIDQFDAKFFGISMKESEYLDPQQRLLHEVSWEAFEDAMIDPSSLKGTQTSFFVGSWIYDYQGIVASKFYDNDTDFFRVYLGNSIGASAARLSHFYETNGPSVATESGCAAGIVAVDLAVKSLRNHETNLAVSCGVNLLIRPVDPKKLSFVVASDGRCKTFDASADGFGRAEGCAVLVMKRLSDAIRNGDRIWGLVRGSAIRQEGSSKSLGTPTVECESLAMELALKDAGVEPEDVSYVETHGTGTPVGDPIEIAAIAKAYASNNRAEPLVIGSVKTNLGHTEAVSGITGIIKVLLAMRRKTIPKHLNLETLNPEIDLSLIPAQIPLTPLPWPREETGKKRLAGVSSFGISGTDGHVIIEEPPVLEEIGLPKQNQLERPLHILKVCAKSQESLDALLKRYSYIFKAKADNVEGFADFAFSANTGRTTFNHRAVIIAKNFSEAAKSIERNEFQSFVCGSSEGKVCFLFTGQGSQYPKMGFELYKTSPVFRHYFDKCNKILHSEYGISLPEVMWKDSTELHRTLYSQTSIFVTEYCLLKLWESWGVNPDYVLGHSLGEFCAAVVAGILTFQDALKLVVERSLLIDKLSRGKMVVIEADKTKVDEEIIEFQKIEEDFWIDYAAFNSTNQTVVAGDSHLAEKFAKHCEGRSIRTKILAASHAFHSRHMDPILKKYGEIAKAIKPLTPSRSCPKYISGLTGTVMRASEIDASYWIRHARESVNFMGACRTLKAEDCSLFLEIGPHPVLSAFMIANIEHEIRCLPSLRRKRDDWETLLGSLAQLHLSDWKSKVDWKGFDIVYSRKRVKVPFYQFNRKTIWTQFTKIYPRIHPLLGSIVPTAAADSIFQVTLTSKAPEYLSDHLIGNNVIFPGAGFLEMCLVGGQAAVQEHTEIIHKPKRPISIKNFRMNSPLLLNDSTDSRLQTVIKLSRKEEGDDDNDDAELGYSVTIHHYDTSEIGEEAGGWVQKARGTFIPVASSMPEELTSEGVNIQSIKESWASIDHEIETYYEKTREIGLRFGPTFQSGSRGWKSNSTVLVKLKVPTDDCEQYLTHPVLIDAMFQVLMLAELWDDVKRQQKLQVIVEVKEFIWLRDVVNSEDLYAFVERNKEGDLSCKLVDANGVACAFMRGAEYMETTVQLIEGMVEKRDKLPGLWRESWKAYPGPLQNSADLSELPEMIHSEETQRLLQDVNEIAPIEKQFYEYLVRLSTSCVVGALQSLGWKPKVGDSFTLEEIMTSCGIRLKFTKFLKFYLYQLERRGALKSTVLGEHYILDKTLDEIVTKDLSFQDGDPKYSQRDEYRLIQKVGESLPSIITGKLDPLAILFPKGGDKPSAEKYYEAVRHSAKGIIDLHVKPTLDQFWNNALEQEKMKAVPRPTFRILEVGAGTWTFTETILSHVADRKWNFEYYFTDLSPAFFVPAEKGFKEFGSSIVFKKFDMEGDPLDQGLCPHYFDLIVAAEVLHISSKHSTSLNNLQLLLKPGGMIMIFEHIVQDPRTTLAFGLLDGFWRGLERQHPHLTSAEWNECLSRTGFERVKIVPYYGDVYGVITAFSPRRSNQGLGRYISSGESKSVWIIFDNDLKLAKEMKLKLEVVDRDVLFINLVDSLPQDDSGASGEEIESFIRNYITAMMEAFLRAGNKIEGILYLWPLSKSCGANWNVALPLLTLCQIIESKLTVMPRVYVTTQDVCQIEPISVSRPDSGTLVGLIRAVLNENRSFKMTLVDFTTMDSQECIVEELFHNLWTSLEHPYVAFRNGLRYIPKLVNCRLQNFQPLSLPKGCDRFQLLLPTTRLISDLEYIHLNQYSLGECEIEVEIRATALNFRDLFAVLKPIEIFEEINIVGFDFSGVVTKVGRNVTKRKVGDRVVGLNLNQKENLSMPSHIKVPENFVVALPDAMTFAEGATFPAAFWTAHYCVKQLVSLKRGDTILIHTASGGVGLFAIQLAQSVGSVIFATAGSPRKRKYLRGLGIEHVFNSRTTDFEMQLLHVTNQFGVDVVLNTLTGEGFKEASLNCLRRGGKFIEISKLNVWSKQEVKLRRPDAEYEILDLTTFGENELEGRNNELEIYLRDSQIKPIPYELFDALNIRGALNYLQKAKHIGKIVCLMPSVKMENSEYKVKTELFNDCSTYVVTGGLGGIGFEVVKWMLNNGAAHIAIATRRKPKPEVEQLLNSWKKDGKHVHIFSTDVGDFNQCKKLFDTLSSPHSGFPQVRGVMHAAGVLQDAILENQSWSKFDQTFNAKVKGTWNLHELTKNLLLEHFVLFSSISAVFGSPGQANHSAGNSFEDTFAYYRRSIGLPATCINWGNWGEVGVATEVDLPGFRPLSNSEGLKALEHLIKTQNSHVVVLNADSFGLAVKFLPGLKNYIDDSKLFGEVQSKFVIGSTDFWKEVDEETDANGRVTVFKKYIKLTVANILKMSADEIDDLADFQSLGIDSLMMLEMKNGIQSVLGSRITLSLSQLKDCSNTEQLSNRLVAILDGEYDPNAQTLSQQELKDLIRDDIKMLKLEGSQDTGPSVSEPNEVRSVLLTGATGTFGIHLLKDLSVFQQIEKIICLVRPRKKQSSMSRIKSKLEELELLEATDLAKVECIDGDVTMKNFGLSDEDYENLATSIDSVIHCCAKVDHLAKYWKAPETSRYDVRTVNVIGTMRVIEFSLSRRKKNLLFPSILMSVTEVDGKGNILEDWQSVGALDNIEYNSGYVLSKHVSEQMLKVAVEEYNLRCKVVRYPYIAGDSKCGRCEFKNNHVVLRWLAYMKLGCMDDLPRPMCAIAVDRCSQATLDLLFHSEAPSGVYNLLQEPMGVEQDLIEVAKEFDVNIEAIEPNAFLERLRADGDKSPMAPFIKMYEEGMKSVIENFQSPSVQSLRRYLESSGNFVESKLTSYVPQIKTGFLETTKDVMKRDLQYLHETGVFEKYGIVTSKI